MRYWSGSISSHLPASFFSAAGGTGEGGALLPSPKTQNEIWSRQLNCRWSRQLGNTSELVRMLGKRCSKCVSPLTVYRTFTQETTVRHELSRWLTAQCYCTKQYVGRFFSRLNGEIWVCKYHVRHLKVFIDLKNLRNSLVWQEAAEWEGKANSQHEASGISVAVPIWQMAGAITK